MFIATITHRNGTNGSGYKSTMEELNAWVEQTAATGMWGKKAGEYKLSELSETELAQELYRRVEDEFGLPLMEPIVAIPAQYEIEITDITAEVEQEKVNAEALAYLSSTDWYAIREAETGVLMPEDVKTARAAARAAIVR